MKGNRKLKVVEVDFENATCFGRQGAIAGPPLLSYDAHGQENLKDSNLNARVTPPRKERYSCLPLPSLLRVLEMRGCAS